MSFSDSFTDCTATAITQPHLLLQILVKGRKMFRFGVVLQEGGRALAEQPVSSAMNISSSSEIRSEAERQRVNNTFYTVFANYTNDIGTNLWH